MSSVMHHVVRRGMEAREHISQKIATMEDFKMPIWYVLGLIEVYRC